jgi:hypothetical protein
MIHIDNKIRLQQWDNILTYRRFANLLLRIVADWGVYPGFRSRFFSSWILDTTTTKKRRGNFCLSFFGAINFTNYNFFILLSSHIDGFRIRDLKKPVSYPD